MIRAILYTTETGHSKEYAELLGKETGLPVHEIREAAVSVPEGSDILYIGWLMAGKIEGYRKASQKYAVRAVCAVGMSGSDSQLNDIRKANSLPADMPVFYLQGGFELEKLHGVYHFMMNTMKKTVGKKLAAKENRTAEEEDMLELLTKGGNRVHKENLSAVVNWFKEAEHNA